MRRGYTFSVLVAMLLALLVIYVQVQFVFAHRPDLQDDISRSRNATLLKAAWEVGAAVPVNVTRGGYLLVEEAHSAAELSDFNTTLNRWQTLLTEFARLSDRNVTAIALDLDGYESLADTLTLANNDSSWSWQGNRFYLNHSGNRSMLNDVIAPVLNTAGCSFNSSGDVSVRVIVNSYDSGEKWVRYGESYDCFLNFSEAQHAHVLFDSRAQMSLDCSACPSSLTHRVQWNTTGERLYVAFAESNVSTAATVNPGWTAPEYPTGTAAAKHYGSGAGYRFIVADTDANGAFDAAFVDADDDGDFTELGDVWLVKTQSVADYGGKAFYTTIDSSGNWVFISKALAVRSTGVQAVTV